MSDYFRRIDAMLAEHVMPPEFRNTHSNIYCNDCEKKSSTTYHFLYHKCGSCRGYNTKLISTFEAKVKPAPLLTMSSEITLNHEEMSDERQSASSQDSDLHVSSVFEDAPS
jgi:hypothetical protein